MIRLVLGISLAIFAIFLAVSSACAFLICLIALFTDDPLFFLLLVLAVCILGVIPAVVSGFSAKALIESGRLALRNGVSHSQLAYWKWVFRLTSSQKRRQAAAAGLTRSGKQVGREEMLRALMLGSKPCFDTAIDAFRSQGGADAIYDKYHSLNELQSQGTDTDLKRKRLAIALARLGDRRAVGCLIEFLDEYGLEVRFDLGEVQEALDLMRGIALDTADEKALEYGCELVSYLSEKLTVERIHSLAKVGDPRASKWLLSNLSGREPPRDYSDDIHLEAFLGLIRLLKDDSAGWPISELRRCADLPEKIEYSVVVEMSRIWEGELEPGQYDRKEVLDCRNLIALARAELSRRNLAERDPIGNARFAGRTLS